MNDDTEKLTVKTKLLMTDPQVFFAAERTLLAWVRSELAVMALGLVIDKFGLFLSVLIASKSNHYQTHQDVSRYLGFY